MQPIKPQSPLHQSMITWRHWLHQRPELSFKEELTSDYIAEVLTSHGIEIHRGLAKTGIVATVHGKHPSDNPKSIGLRADIDALPLQELNEFAHKSQHDGHMHACGHDGHTTMLLGAAVYLKEHNDFSGTVHFIFQPAEEGGAGGKVMVEEGLFDLFPCSAVYGMHNWPGMPIGTFAIHNRAVMAAVDTLFIEITGKGGHAAMPDQLIDPVLTGAQVITALQSVVSRNLAPADPEESAVISITMANAGKASNVMPDTMYLQGTLRYYDNTIGDLIKQRIETIIKHTCEAMGATGSLRIESGYPATINTPEHAENCALAAAKLVSSDAIKRAMPPSMGAEDFAYLLNACEGAYIWIGNGEVSGEHGGCMLHNTRYDFNNDILPLGASYWVELTRMLLT